MEQLMQLATQEQGIFFLYLVVINILTFLAFGVDKAKAKLNRWRIKEATLLGMSLLGGALGGFLGMRVFHHKVRKPKFYIGVPVMLILHVGLLIWYLK